MLPLLPLVHVLLIHKLTLLIQPRPLRLSIRNIHDSRAIEHMASIIYSQTQFHIAIDDRLTHFGANFALAS